MSLLCTLLHVLNFYNLLRNVVISLQLVVRTYAMASLLRNFTTATYTIVFQDFILLCITYKLGKSKLQVFGTKSHTQTHTQKVEE